VIIRQLGITAYAETYKAMRGFTTGRDAGTPDELWLTEHLPVYTVGAAGRPEHLPVAGADARIAVQRIDRGGQITFHGPGQVIVYTLLDLSRREMKVRALVQQLEQSVIELLAMHKVQAARKPGAPGVYVDGEKIAALGLRVTRLGCYHGVALNVDMDLTPFQFIDPCGFPGLAVTQTSALGIEAGAAALGTALAGRIEESLERVHA